MNKHSIIIFAVLCTSSSIARSMTNAISTHQPQAGQFCHGFGEYGYPLAKTDFYLCREGYVVAYNCQTKEPNYVAYHLTPASFAAKRKRKNQFHADLSLPQSCRATLNDYHHSGYDRGHLAPYGSMDFSALSSKQSFLLSNMSPQKKGLNRQGWEKLESDVRRWAQLKGDIYVYTGPIFASHTPKTIGYDNVAVPDYFFKIIYAPKQHQVIAFVMPNKRIKKSQVAQYRTSINAINKRTGITFLNDVNINKDAVSPMWKTHLTHRAKHHYWHGY